MRGSKPWWLWVDYKPSAREDRGDMIVKAAKGSVTGSGCGMGWCDVSFEFRTAREARSAALRVKRAMQGKRTKIRYYDTTEPCGLDRRDKRKSERRV